MSIRHMDGFEQYAAQADLGNTYVLTGAAVWGLSSDTPFGRGKSLACLQPAVNHNGLVRSIPQVPLGAYVGCGFRLKIVAYPYANDYRYLCRFLEGNTWHAGLHIDAGGFLALYRSTAAVAGFSRPLLLDTWYHVEVRVKIGDADGEMEVRVNGETWGLVTGVDTRNGGQGIIDAVSLMQVNAATVNRNGSFLVDNWVVWDTEGTTNNTWVGDAEVLTIFPNADDALGTWVPNTGDAWDAINDVGSDGDTTYISSETVGDEATFGLEAPAVAPANILAIGTSVVGRKSDSGTRSIQHGIVSGIDEALGPGSALGTSYAASHAIFEADPATGDAWLAGAIGSLKTKIKVSA
ncbi:MAG: hypothetical protein M9945_14255 [Aquamicrobium sp.]|uniref:hypothetical protein n=1 Tax=Aquamicrobium sp. TaxID=1872579 RepID=UPI00349EA49D|nr:hypothetical protein [Aquamicrobium sp.]